MADSGAVTESSLLSKLQSSADLSSTHHLFSTFLHPFSAVLNTKPKKQSSKSSKPDSESSTLLIRPLAKKFLPFLNKTLSLLPKRLSETPKIDACYAEELFETYKLCLSCLDSIASQLNGKPHSPQIQRVRLMHCYENWGRYQDAQVEGFLVLQSFMQLFPGKRGGKLKGRIVPELGKENGADQDVAALIVEVVVTIIKCVGLYKGKDETDYRRVLRITEEIRPWFRVIDADAYEKMHRLLVTYLSKCTMFLVGELASFDGNLAHQFCSVTFSELANSSLKDQMNKVARSLCCSLFSLSDNQLLHSLDVLMCVLDSMAHEYKVGKEKTLVEFLELVCYCAIKCQTAAAGCCGAVATNLDKLAGDISQVNLSPVDLIMRLYAIGLYFSDLNCYSRESDSKMTKAEKKFATLRVLLNKDDQLQSLRTTLGSLRCHYNISTEAIGLPLSADVKDLVIPRHELMEAYCEAAIDTHNKMTYMPSYFSALKFLCEPISELINSGREEVLAGLEGVSFPVKLRNIQDALHQFSLVFLTYSASERGKDLYDDNNKVVLAVAVAAFTLSFTTKQNIKESYNIVVHLISSDWLQASGLKSIYASLYNIGVSLFRSNRLAEATLPLKLCCKAAWKCVLCLCKVFAANRDGVSSNLSEDIADFATEACAKSAFLLDVLYQCGSQEVEEILTDSLESWAGAQNLFDKIPSPTALVKQWVKIECKLLKDAEVEHRVPTIYCLMSSSTKMSRKTLGILLEQELQAYKEMKSVNPGLCRRMQMAVTTILLEEIYMTKDSWLQKSRILIAKARESRTCGVECLNDCIKYLSEAISAMNDAKDESKGRFDEVRHQLAEAYCLRALSTQEAEPNSKQFVQDTGNALKLWLSPDLSADQTHMVSWNTLTLLFYVADLLSIKGYMKHHPLIYEMMIRLFKLNNVPFEKCLPMLWQSRSLSHALCGSPLSDEFIVTLSKHCNLSKSLDFWISCMEQSQTLKVGFQHSLLAQPHIAIDELKQAASDLITCVPLSRSSMFLASSLYYDLGERLVTQGHMIEALFYAKEAHSLLSKLFKENFMYSKEKQNETSDPDGEFIQKSQHVLKTFQMHPSVATAAWSYDKGFCGFEEFILTPWNVLKCYLESTLQVGTIHEIVGNGSEAEAILLWGKSISCSQGLSIFLVSFSFTLGKLYRKQRLWHLAEKELESAKLLLANSCGLISCLKCKLVWEVTVDQQLGDLLRSHLDINSGNKLYEGLSEAENLYRSAIEKLNLSEWRNCVSNPDPGESSPNTMFCDALLKVGSSATRSSSHYAANDGELNFPSKIGGKQTTEPKLTRKNKKCPQPLQREQATTCRITRSRFQSYKIGSEYAQNEVQHDFTQYSEKRHVYACADALNGNGPQPKVDGAVACGCEVTCHHHATKCWHCVSSEIMKSASLKSSIQIKWEHIRRRLLLRVLTGIGKCFGIRGEIHKAHEVLSESISILVSRSTFHPTYFSIPFAFLVELIEKKFIGDDFAVEHASILYNLCWFSLKSFHGKGTRSNCCDLACIPIPKLVSGLKSSFIFCREVPALFQKVSRLLAVLYTLSTSNEEFSLSYSSSKALSESHWASYFHQASLGSHLNHQLCSRIEKQNVHKTMDVEGSCISSLASLSLLRLAPESVQDLEGFVLTFFQGLPCIAIVCISMLSDAFTGVLRNILVCDPPTHAWIMLSRLNADCQPVNILLPVNSILEGSEDDEDSSSSFLFNRKSYVKPWHCPWDYTVIDRVAPVFKSILEENYVSSSAFPLENTKKNRTLWWAQRRKLDQLLQEFLRNLEDLWLGPWKYLLLGELSNCKHLDSLQKKLMDDLKLECNIDVHESILKLIIGGAELACQREECLSGLILKKGCYVGGLGCHNDETPGKLSSKRDVNGSIDSSVCKLILEAVHDIEEEFSFDREPIILVLDFEIQMLPWESLPVLRSQEIYRMPSIASISSTFDRCFQHQEKVRKNSSNFPMIDPLDAYYLLNPSGDLSRTEGEFANWFRTQHLEGKTGTTPSVEELSVALKSHDLFIYLGHGSGTQYIPGYEIQKLDRCAATLLMGCGSGCLSLNGPYTPRGAPLHYLLAGSPIIIANLWEVTDMDIDRFGKAMLDGWIRERSSTSDSCPQCNEIAEKLKNMNLDGGKRKGKRKTARKKSLDTCEVDAFTFCCKHRPKIGSFMGQAREACNLPFLIGASPVCYGVPTGIRKKEF